MKRDESEEHVLDRRKERGEEWLKETVQCLPCSLLSNLLLRFFTLELPALWSG